VVQVEKEEDGGGDAAVVQALQCLHLLCLQLQGPCSATQHPCQWCQLGPGSQLLVMQEKLQAVVHVLLVSRRMHYVLREVGYKHTPSY
jgi:hypothetical protein